MPKAIHSRVVLEKSKIIRKNLSKDGVVGYAYRDENGILRAEVDPKQTDREFFLTACHELGHNLLPDLTEKQIIKLEKNFGVNLWKVVCYLRRKWKNHEKELYLKA